jgi:hypothetical protein
VPKKPSKPSEKVVKATAPIKKPIAAPEAKKPFAPFVFSNTVMPKPPMAFANPFAALGTQPDPTAAAAFDKSRHPGQKRLEALLNGGDQKDDE